MFKKDLKSSKSECISSEITVPNKKWLCFSIFRPFSYDNLELFLDEPTSSLSKASESYENFIVIGDFNIEVTNKGIEFDKLNEFCDSLNLTKLVTSPTCFTKTHISKIYLILTNKGNCFHEIKVTETGLNDFHKLISTFLRSHFSRLKPKAS